MAATHLLQGLLSVVFVKIPKSTNCFHTAVIIALDHLRDNIDILPLASALCT